MSKRLVSILCAVSCTLLSFPGCKKEEKKDEPAAAAAPSWKAGDLTDVEWNSAWWQGKVLEVNSGKYKIHYIGWDARWDETVGPERLRKSSGTAKKGSSPEN